MGKYVALQDFKVQPTYRHSVLAVKKGQVIELIDNQDFPDLENKMMTFKYVRRIEDKDKK